MVSKIFFSVLLLAIIMTGCNPKTEVNKTSKENGKDSTRTGITVSAFGLMPDGTKNSLYTLTNENGVVMKVMNYGGIITSLMVPDKNGNLGDVVLGFDSLDSYLKNNPYFGALIGRYGNRIAKGKFSLDGKQYTLPANNAPNHLHGGVKGFDKVAWNIERNPVDKGVSVQLTYDSKDMEEGYPGNIHAEVIYRLTDKDELYISYKATTDKKTIVNLTQHTYFNLNGAKRDILDHELSLDANMFLPVDQTLIPKGSPLAVENTPFDFRKPAKIGARINKDEEQLKFGKGYDHCWILSGTQGGLNKAAVLYDSASGREVIVYTTEPGIQFYSGNFLDGSNKGKDGVVYNHRFGLCLETQHFPDSPNRPDFPSVVLNPGETYSTETVYKFSTR